MPCVQTSASAAQSPRLLQPTCDARTSSRRGPEKSCPIDEHAAPASPHPATHCPAVLASRAALSPVDVKTAHTGAAPAAATQHTTAPARVTVPAASETVHASCAADERVNASTAMASYAPVGSSDSCSAMDVESKGAQPRPHPRHTIESPVARNVENHIVSAFTTGRTEAPLRSSKPASLPDAARSPLQ
jgi:hypothetical protein